MPATQEEEQWETTAAPFPQEIKFETEGAQWEGAYLRTDVIDLTDDDGNPRPTNLHVFRGDDDAEYSIWGSHNLDKGVKDVPVGARTRVTFERKIEGLKGGRSVKEFTVQYRKK